MPRSARIDAAGALYHVIARGIERRHIFLTDHDRHDFLCRLSDLVTAGTARLFAYVLLDNHFHLLVERTDRPLSHFMQRLLTGYAVAFNLRHARVGHLFQNRYRSVLCERDPYLLELVRYIHRNPVRAGIVGSPEQYPWSSHRAYLGQVAFSELDCAPVLALFGPRLSEARRRFRAFVAMEAAAQDDAELAGWSAGAAAVPGGRPLTLHLGGTLLGSPAFAEHTVRRSGYRTTLAEQCRSHGVGPAQLAAIVCRLMGIDEPALRQRGRCRSVSAARELLIVLAVDAVGLRGQEVATYLNQTRSAVSHALARARQHPSPDTLARAVDALQSLLRVSP